NACTGPRSIRASARNGRRRCCANSSPSGARVLTLEATPNRHRCRIARAEAACVAGSRLEVRAVAEPQFLQPAAFVELHADLLLLPAGVGADEGVADRADGQPLAARETVEIGQAQ